MDILGKVEGKVKDDIGKVTKRVTGSFNKLFANPIDGKFDLIRTILVIYSVIFLLQCIAGGMVIGKANSGFQWTIVAPDFRNLGELVTIMGGYLYKRTTDQNHKDKEDDKTVAGSNPIA